MEQIRISKGIEIGVNDEGESIRIDAEDVNFLNRYQNLIIKTNEISDKYKPKFDNETNEFEAINTTADMMSEVMAEMDILFGERACEKIFGRGVIPTPYAMIELFDKLEPIVEKYSKGRSENIMKKYVARKGGHK